MNAPSSKTRFAPSPTGFMHMGNARTALFSLLAAKGGGGRFLLRIEDTDRVRSEERYLHALLEDLRWLGLDWDEGPEVGGTHGPYLQSQRGEVYASYFSRLEEQGRAYPCFCSEQDLAQAREAQLRTGRPPRYSGTCAQLTPQEVRERLARGERATLRFRVPAGGAVEFQDLVRGPQSFQVGDIGDFIIRRADGSPAFFFSNAIDDALMEVTLVLRGEDHLANTARQMLLLRALELPVPDYGHLSMIVGHDGSPLSKRHGSLGIRELREAGFLPGAVVNHLARLGHYYGDDVYLGLDGLAAGFDVARLGRSPAQHDDARLLFWQKEAVSHAGDDELWQWMGFEVHRLVPERDIQAFVETVRPNVVLPEDALQWARIIYCDPLTLDDEATRVVQQAGGDFFQHALKALALHQADFKALAEEVKTHTGAKGKALFMPLRAALTGVVHGPEMGRVLPLLSPSRARDRLQVWVNNQ